MVALLAPSNKKEATFFQNLAQMEAAIKKLENDVEMAELALELTTTDTRLATEEETIFARDTDETHAQLKTLENAFNMKVRRDSSMPGKLFIKMNFPEDAGTVPPLKFVLDVNGDDLRVDVCEPPVFVLDALLKDTNINNSEGARAAFIATLRDKHKLYRAQTHLN
jgi:mRNA-degrading endonuclease HigB of HigAB toxin-antitoxin module